MRVTSFLILLLLAWINGISLAEEDASAAPTTADQHVDILVEDDSSSINGPDDAGQTTAELATDAAAKSDESDGDSSDNSSTGEEVGEGGGKEEEEEEEEERAEEETAVEGVEHDGEDEASGVDGDDTGSYEAASGDTSTTQEDEGEDSTASSADDADGGGFDLSGTEENDVVPSSGVDDDSLTAAAAAEAPLSREDVADGDSLSSPEERVGAGDGFIDGWGKHGIEGERHPFRHALASYDALLKEHYLKMSFAQATALGVLGDTIAQRLERRWNPGQEFEWKRTAHAGILNMAIDGVFTPHWYNLVDFVNAERTLPVAFVKALAASVFYAPFANGLFLAGARTLRYGLKAHFDWAEWRRQLLVCTIRDFEMWPPLHILSFWLLPKHWRPLTSHLAGVALLAVISSTGLTDAELPLGQRAVPLMMRWAREAAGAVGERVRGNGRRVSGAPRST